MEPAALGSDVGVVSMTNVASMAAKGKQRSSFLGSSRFRFAAAAVLAQQRLMLLLSGRAARVPPQPLCSSVRQRRRVQPRLGVQKAQMGAAKATLAAVASPGTPAHGHNELRPHATVRLNAAPARRARCRARPQGRPGRRHRRRRRRRRCSRSRVAARSREARRGRTSDALRGRRRAAIGGRDLVRPRGRGRGRGRGRVRVGAS